MVTRSGWIQAIAAAGLLLAANAGAFGQVVRIRKEITVQPRQDVRLGDLATVTGGDRQLAEALANTVIISGVDGDRTVRTESILLALMSQRGAPALSNLQVQGSVQCAITVAKEAPPQAGEPAAGTPVITASVVPSDEAKKPNATPAAETTSGQTLTKIITARVQKELNAGPEDVHVLINTISPLLDAPVAGNRKWLCRPLSRTLLGTVMFEAQLVEGSRVLEKLNVQTHVERRQTVVIAVGRLDRGDLASSKNIRVDEAWLDRTMPNLFGAEKDVLGLEAQRSIEVGSMLDQRDFKPAVLAQKNDPVTVIYLSGALKVQMRGRAQEDGKLHDQISIRNEATGERYQAVLIGKRLAVVGGTLDAAEEQKLRELQ